MAESETAETTEKTPKAPKTSKAAPKVADKGKGKAAPKTTDKGKAATADADGAASLTPLVAQGAPEEMREVAIDEINVDPNFNIDPNRATDESKIRPLAESIRQLGLQQPIVLRAIVSKGRTIYHLNEGFRRLKAVEILGWKNVPCVIKTFDDLGALLANSAENTCREPPHPMFLAKRMEFIKQKHQLSDEQIAHAFGLSKKHVQNLLRAHKNLAPKLHKDVFSSQSASMADESPSLQWCIEVAKLSHDEQIEAYETRFGRLAKEGAEKKKGKAEGGEKPTRMRNRTLIMETRHRHLRKLSDKMVEAGYGVELKLKGYEGKLAKVTERDRDILKAAFDWLLDNDKPYFLNYIEPSDEEEEEGEE
jgi:ParB/RepB/Spo0J family partition protein